MKKFILAVTFSFCTFHFALCIDFNKSGTAVGQFLKIGVGARQVGMGESFTGIADDQAALYYNPAGIASLSQIGIAATHTRWFADLTHQFVGFVLPLKNNGSVGLSATGLNSGETEITTIEQPDGTGESFTYQALALGVSYARYLTDRFTTGLTLKYVQENLYNEAATGFAVDVGTLLKTGFYGTRIAMCLTNFGTGMKLAGRDLVSADGTLETQTFPLPLNFRVGIGADILGPTDAFIKSRFQHLIFAFDYNHPNDHPERANLGLEYGFHQTLFFRAGYKINYDESGFSYGGGLALTQGKTNFKLDYAWADLGRLQAVHRFSIAIEF